MSTHKDIQAERCLVIDCSELPGFVALTENPALRQGILRELNEESQQILLAASVIRTQIYRTATESFLKSDYDVFMRLRKLGYQPDEICNALASAWIREEDKFYLPKISWSSRIDGKIFCLMTSVFLSLLSLVGLIIFLRHQNPELGATLLYFEPVLAGIGIFLTFAYYFFIDRLRLALIRFKKLKKDY